MQTNSLRAACLARREAGVFGRPDEFVALWRADGRELRLDFAKRSALPDCWHDAVERTLSKQD